MGIEDTEIKIGGTSFKGIYVAILLSLATSLGGVFWSASSLYSRLEAVESRKIPNVQPMQEEIQLIKQQLVDNDISQLQAKLATLGTNLETILDQQEKLLELKSELSTLEKEIEAMKGVVAKAEVITADNQALEDQLKIVGKEINDLWMAMDDLSQQPIEVIMLDQLIAPVSGLLEGVIKNKSERAKLAHEISTMAERHAQQIALAQIEVNKAEAKGNWFQSSWRPATAWVCVLGFTVNFLVSPIAHAFGIDVPQADTSVMLPVLMGMLGLGGLRTMERVKGVSK